MTLLSLAMAPSHAEPPVGTVVQFSYPSVSDEADTTPLMLRTEHGWQAGLTKTDQDEARSWEDLVDGEDASAHGHATVIIVAPGRRENILARLRRHLAAQRTTPAAALPVAAEHESVPADAHDNAQEFADGWDDPNGCYRDEDPDLDQWGSPRDNDGWMMDHHLDR